jgi:SDR family mycofactocin-dependent oxidoreductase
MPAVSIDSLTRSVRVRVVADLIDTVAVVTGAARGQGRSHAVALAAEGADIIAIDRCADIESIPYPLASKEDLDETVRLVEARGRRIIPVIADVRDLAALQAGVQSGINALGDIDIVVANAGVVAIGLKDPLDEQVYRDIVETNLTGVWHTIAATVPSVIRKGRGGSVILTSSAQGLVGKGGDGSAAMFGYAAAKHGVVGLMRSAANAYAQHNIRVNTVHPSGVGTPMILNDHTIRTFQENPNGASLSANLLPVPFVEAEDVTNAVVWLASPKARYVTGVALPVDAGHAVM